MLKSWLYYLRQQCGGYVIVLSVCVSFCEQDCESISLKLDVMSLVGLQSQIWIPGQFSVFLTLVE